MNLEYNVKKRESASVFDYKILTFERNSKKINSFVFEILFKRIFTN